MIKLFFLLTLARSVNCLACYDSGGNYVACYACAYADITGAACSVGNYPTLSNTCVVTTCTACSNLPASGYYYSTTSDQNYYSTAAITTEVSLAI